MQTLPKINALQLIYKQKAYGEDAKDYEFGLISVQEHWRAGYYDTRNTLKHLDWLQFNSQHGIRSYDLHGLVNSLLPAHSRAWQRGKSDGYLRSWRL